MHKKLKMHEIKLNARNVKNDEHRQSLWYYKSQLQLKKKKGTRAQD